MNHDFKLKQRKAKNMTIEGGAHTPELRNFFEICAISIYHPRFASFETFNEHKRKTDRSV